MSRIAARARRVSHVPAVTPASMFGSSLVGWWRADDLAGLTDGVGIASWADKSANANTLTQATSANRPTKQTDAAGLTLARFTAASQHALSKDSATGLKDAPGPLCVLVVARPASLSGDQMIVEFSGGGTTGFAAGLHGGDYGLTDYVHGYGVTATGGASALRLIHYQMDSATTQRAAHDNLYELQVGTGMNYQPGATRLSFGGLTFAATTWFGGDLYEVIYLDRVPTPAEKDRLARAYVWPRYKILPGNRFNAPARLTTPTICQTYGNAATADGSIVEMSVRYFPAGWNGKKYWMAAVPYKLGPPSENPNLLCSDDNVTWAAAAGVTNPLVVPRATGNNADPRLVYNPTDGKLYLFYIVETDPGSLNGVYALSSADGSTWTAPTKVIDRTAGGDSLLEPSVIWDGSRWVMYCVDASTGRGGASGATVTRRTSTALMSGWSAPVDCTYALPGGRKIWHMDVAYDPGGGRMVLCASDNDASRNLWLLSSQNGTTFSSADAPLLVRSVVNWDKGTLYRPSLSPPDDTTTDWRLWYTMNISNPESACGYTTFPATEIP